MDILRYTLKYTRPIRGRLLTGILLLAVSMTLSIAGPILMGRYIDLLSARASFQQLVTAVLLLVLLWLTGTMVSYISAVNSSHMHIRLMYGINFHLLRHAERLPYAYLSKTDTVYLNNRIHNDSAVLASFLLDTLLGAAAKAVTCLAVLGIILHTAPFVGALILLLLPAYGGIYLCFRKRMERSSKAMMECRDVFFGEMQKQLRHIRTIKLNAWYDRLYASLLRQFDPVYGTAIRNTKLNALYGSFTQITQIAANIIIFLACGLAVSGGSMKLGSLITVNSLFAMLFSSFSSLMESGRSYTAARAAFGRVRELEDMEEERDGTILPEAIRQIQVQNLTFRYSEDQRILLDRISLTFEKGKIYQIQGENGCGKSTLLDLLLGLYETGGEICLDGIPLQQLNMTAVRQKLVAIVEQEPPLVFRRISENLTDDGLDSLALTRRIQASGLDAVLGSLNLETDRSLPDGTIGLSGGEKQKLAILRALLKDVEVLILDEPASALDSRSCSQLKGFLNEMKKDHIIILVDHQAVFADIVDIHYHLHGGRITVHA